jgi:hypothetical protein
MSWESHIDVVTSKLKKACYIARVIRPFLSLYFLRAIYHAYFLSVHLLGNIDPLALIFLNFRNL